MKGTVRSKDWLSVQIALCIAGLSGTACAQEPVAVCLAMVTDASRNVGVQTNSSAFLNTIYSDYCQTDGSTKNSAFSVGISGIIESLPVNLTGGNSDSSTETRNFCKNYQSIYARNSDTLSSQSTVVQNSLESANDHLKIATETRSIITYKIETQRQLYFDFVIPSGQTLNIHGVNHEDFVDCTGSKIPGSGKFAYSTGVGQDISAAAGVYTLECFRKPTKAQDGTPVFSETAVTVDTNFGILHAFWPQDVTLPITSARQIESKVSDIDAELLEIGAEISNIQKTLDNHQDRLSTLEAEMSTRFPARDVYNVVYSNYQQDSRLSTAGVEMSVGPDHNMNRIALIPQSAGICFMAISAGAGQHLVVAENGYWYVYVQTNVDNGFTGARCWKY